MADVLSNTCILAHTILREKDAYDNTLDPIVLESIIDHLKQLYRHRAVESWHGPQGYIVLPGPLRDGFGRYKTPYRGKIYRFRVVGFLTIHLLLVHVAKIKNTYCVPV